MSIGGPHEVLPSHGYTYDLPIPATTDYVRGKNS